MSFIDRVAAGLDTLGKKTQQVFDESKLRMDVARVRRRKDNAARDLGYVAYRTAKGEILPEGEADVLIRRITAAEEEIAKIEAEIEKVKGAGAAAETPPPAAETPPPADPGATPAV
jgi:capsule polysaccharide export protein KpsE/RkpR